MTIPIIVVVVDTNTMDIIVRFENYVSHVQHIGHSTPLTRCESPPLRLPCSNSEKKPTIIIAIFDDAMFDVRRHSKPLTSFHRRLIHFLSTHLNFVSSHALDFSTGILDSTS